MITMDFAQTVKLMTEIVAEFGEDHIAPSRDGSCHYFNDTVPDCGVGQLFARVGVTSDMLTGAENNTAVANLIEDRKHSKTPFIEMDGRSLYFLQSFQSFQDTNGAWGEALQVAHLRDATTYGK
jgi:hypothetical protein